MQDSQAIDLVLGHEAVLVVFGRFLHIKREFSELLHVEELI